MIALSRAAVASAHCAARLAVRFAAAASNPGPATYPSFVKDYPTLIEMQTASCNQFKDFNFIGTWKGKKFEYITYKQFGDDVDRFRAALAQLGVGKDDKVAIISNNRLEWAVAYYAANGRGAQLVPLYEAQTEQDWEFIIQNCDAKLLIAATPKIYHKTKTYVGNKFPNLKSVICLDDDDSAITYRSLMSGTQPSGAPPPVPLSPDDLTAIVYTSGSTGNPKGVCLSHRNILANLKGMGVKISCLPSCKCSCQLRIQRCMGAGGPGDCPSEENCLLPTVVSHIRLNMQFACMSWSGGINGPCAESRGCARER